MKLNLMHVAAPAPVGGLEYVVQALARGQAEAGHEVHVVAVVTRRSDADPFASGLRAAPVALHIVDVHPRAYGRERASVRDLCRQFRPHIVHTHGYRPDVVDGGIARGMGIPTVSTVHGFTRTSPRGRIYEWIQRRSLRRFEAVVAVSKPQVVELARAGVARERIHFVPNAWVGAPGPSMARTAARQALGVPAEAFHIGWVGRLSHEKGADVLIDALALLDDVPWIASIIGEGGQRRALQQRALEQGCADRIRWHGLMPAAERLFAGYDAFVLSSRTEGTPIVLFEAMAAGTPIVASAVGGVPDVVPADCALLVRAERPSALAVALRNVYEDRAAATRRSASAHRRLLSEFAASRWLQRYESLYRRLSRNGA